MGQVITPPISNLPPEILSSIFLFNTSGSLDSCYGSNLVKVSQDTARYTSQVCRQWRFLLLENPIIWSRCIDFTYGSHLWTEELLRRAADCPLILVSSYGLLEPHILARELEHVSRFGRYDREFKMDSWPLLLDKLHQPAPYLEELSLWGSDSGQCKLPATIFGGNAPRLRRLRLRSCSFDEALPYLPQLTHLCESDINGPSFPPKKWLDILPSMPLLTVLELNGVDIGTGPLATVHLPNLTEITMATSLRESSAFLSCLVLPPACSIRVTARNSWPGADFDITAGIIIKKFQSNFTQSIESDHRLCLDFGINFFAISNLVSRTGAGSEPKTLPCIHFHTALERGLLSILPQVSSAFAAILSLVSSIELSLNGQLTSKALSAIANVLLQANNVTSLVRLNSVSARALLQLGRVTGTQTEEDVIFPSLRLIHISNLVMRRYAASHVVQPFVDFIRYRLSIAAPIEEICYSPSSGVSGEDAKVEYLKETGVRVTERDWF